MDAGLKDLIGGANLVGQNDASVSVEDAIKDADLIGIYFSAHWCGPCRQFTPKLSKLYKDWTAQGKKIVIIFASSDSDAASWKSYFGEMPWYSFPFNDPRKEKLDKLYKVSGIPWLAIVDKKGKLLENEADSRVGSEGAGAVDSWAELLK